MKKSGRGKLSPPGRNVRNGDRLDNATPRNSAGAIHAEMVYWKTPYASAKPSRAKIIAATSVFRDEFRGLQGPNGSGANVSSDRSRKRSNENIEMTSSALCAFLHHASWIKSLPRERFSLSLLAEIPKSRDFRGDRRLPAPGTSPCRHSGISRGAREVRTGVSSRIAELGLRRGVAVLDDATPRFCLPFVARWIHTINTG